LSGREHFYCHASSEKVWENFSSGWKKAKRLAQALMDTIDLNIEYIENETRSAPVFRYVLQDVISIKEY
jgi:hypothetical protein